MINLTDEIKDFKPYFKENNIAIFLSITSKWTNIAGVTLASIVKNANKGNNYDIIILENGIEDIRKNKLLEYKRKNISIRFINVSDCLSKFNLQINPNLTIATFYRLLAPVLFKNYTKILYTDTDTIFLKDAANVFNNDISEYHIGVVRELGIIHYSSKSNPKYYKEYCGIKNIENSFNAGVILFNVEKINSDDNNLCEKWLNMGEEKYYTYSDQDILNIYYDRNPEKITFLSHINNYYFSVAFYKKMPENVLKDYKKYEKDAIIYHYIGLVKPWKQLFKCPKSFIWWKYAIFSLFFKEIIYNYLYIRFEKYITAYNLCRI